MPSNNTAIYGNSHRKDYSTHQTEWEHHSHNTVVELSESIKRTSTLNLLTLLEKLGEKRQEIAAQLGHGSGSGSGSGSVGSNNTPYDFGDMRYPISDGPACLMGEPTIYVYPNKCLYNDKTECPLSFDFINKTVLPKLNDPNIFIQKTDPFGDSFYHYFDKSAPYINKSVPYSYGWEEYFASKAPREGFRFHINVLKGGNDKPNNLYKLKVCYATSSKNHINTLQPYLDSALKANGLETLLINLGKLAYHLFRLLPFRRGTAAITEWLVRGIAMAKGYTLEAKKAGAILDWQAFFTFSEEEYGQWFMTNAFETCNNTAIHYILEQEKLKYQRVSREYAEYLDSERRLINGWNESRGDSFYY